MPELAAGYLVGFILTLCLMGLHIYLQSRKQKSPAMRQVQSNLKKINLFWSDSESEIKDYIPGAEKSDAEKSIRSILVSGVGFSLLSWLGLFFQFVVMISLRFLAVKRIETKLFQREIAEKELNTEKTREFVNQIMQS